MSNSKLIPLLDKEDELKRSRTSLTETFSKILECPICFEVPLTTPILLCQSGHLICSECRKRVNQCGLCGKKFTSVRNYTVEGMIEKFYFKCKYEEQGCSEVQTGSLMYEHQKNCYFRNILCNDKRETPCFDNPIDVTDFIHHLNSVHHYYGTENETGICEKIQRSNWDKNDADWNYFYIKFRGKYFIGHTQADEECIYWWMSLIGTAKEANEYYSVTTVLPLATAQPPHRKIEFTLPIHTIRKSSEAIRTGNIAVLPKPQLEFFSTFAQRDPEGRLGWRMRFKILKKELNLGSTRSHGK